MRREGEVLLGPGNMNMPEKRGEARQETLDVLSFLVPLDKSMSRRRMPKIMQPRLKAGSVVTQHDGLYPQAAERVLGSGTAEPITGTPDK